MNKFKGTKKKKKYVTMDEVLKNTYVHLVLMDDGSLWAHTHGMERYELQNISMRAENESYTTFCHHFLMELALDMINGEKYKLNWGHIQDDITTGDVLHGFYLMPSDDIDDNTGKQNIEAVYYYDEELQYNGKSWRFDKENKKWNAIHKQWDLM